jgi:hypothetical protein
MTLTLPDAYSDIPDGAATAPPVFVFGHLCTGTERDIPGVKDILSSPRTGL